MGVRSEVGSIAPLDGLRGIAVLWVILFHYCALREPAGDPWVEALKRVPALEAVVRNGYLGVDLFFLLSGFLLVLPWLVRAHAGETAPAALPFYRRRFLRIAPAYYVQLVLMFLLAVPLLRGFDYWRRDFYVMVWNVVAHAGFVHNTNPLTSGSLAVNGALWTLAVEAQFYLLLPLVAPLFARAPATATSLAFIAAAAWQWAARHGLEPLVAGYMALGTHWAWPESVIRNLLVTQLPSYLGHFALGALLARAWLAWREARPGAARRAALLATGLLGALLLVGVLASRRALWGEQTWLLTTAALGALLFAAAAGKGWIARTLLARGPLAFAGRISYSAYLYHLPVLLLGMRITNGTSIALLPAYLAIVAGIAWLSWRFVEQRYYAGRDSPRWDASARARAHGEREDDRHRLQ
jgi:peptidoglycan/LPS O-acetylase OafA/YrhL